MSWCKYSKLSIASIFSWIKRKNSAKHSPI